jgi:multidrug efflux pump
MGLTVYLAYAVPKGFFPQQDTGRLSGSIVADESISFTAMKGKMIELVKIVQADPAVDTVVAFVGGGGGTTTNSGRAFISLKPLAERKVTADQIISRLRPKTAGIPGATLFLQAVQDVRVGGRMSSAQYQYTIQSDSVAELNTWGPKVLTAMKGIPILSDANSDAQNKGLSASLVIDRATAARMGITPSTIDQTLYDAFGERQVAKTFTSINQYFVVMEVAPQFWTSPEGLNNIYVSSSSGGVVPLSAFTHYAPKSAPLSVSHSGVFPSQTISFNLKQGSSLGPAIAAINAAEQKIGMPATITGQFSGTAEAFTSSLANEPLLIGAALAAVYIVLGILYESFVHPITILSTLPSASAGAILALMVTHTDLSLIALIGIILLIGIVKKNAIMMIDFALEVERSEHKTPKEAAFQACLLRFRPIMMTTMAALLGSLPLALGTGMGAELRRPLGITIVGGLIVSQALTLYSTPVIYLYMDRLNNWISSLRVGNRDPADAAPATEPA